MSCHKETIDLTETFSNLNDKDNQLNERISKTISTLIGAAIGWLLGEQTNVIIKGSVRDVSNLTESLIDAKENLTDKQLTILEREKDTIITPESLIEKTGIELCLPIHPDQPKE